MNIGHIAVLYKDKTLARYALKEQKLLWKTDVSDLDFDHLSMDFILNFIERDGHNYCTLLADYKEKIIYYYDNLTGEYVGKSKIINEKEMIRGEYGWIEKQ